MKALLSRSAIVGGLALVLSAVSAQADQRWPESFGYVGVQGSYFDAGKGRDNLDNIDNFWQYAAQVGYRFNPRFSAQLQYGEGDTDTRQTNIDVDSRLITLTGRAHWHEMSLIGFVPYGGAGYGYNRLKVDGLGTKREDAIVLEAGLQRLLGTRFMLDGGLRALVELDDGFVDTQPFIALDFLFGKRYAAAPVATPRSEIWMDSDGDGVPDHLDQCPNTPAGALVDDVGCPIMLTESVNITLYVEFDLDSTTVKPEFFEEIGQISEVLTQYPGSEVLLEGHTDSTGSASYNQNLSLSRADAVMRVLVSEFGIDSNRIRTSGMGLTQPIADNSTEEGRARNRRVEAVVQATREEMKRR